MNQGQKSLADIFSTIPKIELDSENVQRAEKNYLQDKTKRQDSISNKFKIITDKELFLANYDPKLSLQAVTRITNTINRAYRKETLIKILSAYSRFGWYDFENLLDVILAFLRLDEKAYMDEIEKTKKSRHQKEILESYAKILGILLGFFCFGNYDDILGMVYQDSIISNFYAKESGTFYTPFNIALMMNKMLLGDLNELNTSVSISLNDPTCGSGVMFIAGRYLIHEKFGWKKSSVFPKFIGQDISFRATKMCQIQLIMTNHLYMRDMLYVRTYEANSIIKNKECKFGICAKPDCKIHPRKTVDNTRKLLLN